MPCKGQTPSQDIRLSSESWVYDDLPWVSHQLPSESCQASVVQFEGASWLQSMLVAAYHTQNDSLDNFLYSTSAEPTPGPTRKPHWVMSPGNTFRSCCVDLMNGLIDIPEAGWLTISYIFHIGDPHQSSQSILWRVVKRKNQSNLRSCIFWSDKRQCSLNYGIWRTPSSMMKDLTRALAQPTCCWMTLWQWQHMHSKLPREILCQALSEMGSSLPDSCKHIPSSTCQLGSVSLVQQKNNRWEKMLSRSPSTSLQACCFLQLKDQQCWRQKFES